MKIFQILYMTLCLFFLNSLSSQEKKQIVIKCKHYDSPLVDVTVIYQKNKFLYSDKNGIINVPILKNTNYVFSAVNYKSTTLTSEQLENKTTVYLELDIFNLDQVILTGASGSQKIDKSIYNIKVIEGSHLDNLGANTLNDALMFESNINISQDMVLGTKISMQGLEGQHIKVLIDGVPVVGRLNGNIDLSQIDISNIDHIEIIEGPLSVIYGTNALGGTINIITKKNITLEKFNLSLTTYLESVGQYNGKVILGQNIKDHNFSLDFGRNQFTGYDNDKETREVMFNPKIQYFLNSNYYFSSNSYTIDLGYNFSMEELNILGNYLGPLKEHIDTKYITTRNIVFGKVHLYLDSNNVSQNQISYSQYSRKVNPYYIDGDEKILMEDTDTNIFENLNARTTLENKFEKIDLQSGVDYNFDKGKGGKISGEKTMNDVAAWSNLTYKFSEHLNIQSGMRVIYNDNFSAPILYSLSSYWNDDDNYKIKLSTAKGFRTPSIKERYLDFVDANHKIFGNENLKPETSYHFSGQFSYKRTIKEDMGVTFDLSLFYNILSDVIELALEKDENGNFTSRYVYQNIGNKKTYGGNIFISSQKYKLYKTKFGVDYLGTIYKTDSESNWYGNNYNFIASLTYTIGWGIDTDVNIDYKYNGPMILLLLNSTEQELDKGVRNSYNMMNLSLNKTFWKDNIDVNIGIKNLFNVVNVISTNQSGVHSVNAPISWGTTYFVGVKFKIL